MVEDLLGCCKFHLTTTTLPTSAPSEKNLNFELAEKGGQVEGKVSFWQELFQ